MKPPASCVSCHAGGKWNGEQLDVLIKTAGKTLQLPITCRRHRRRHHPTKAWQRQLNQWIRQTSCIGRKGILDPAWMFISRWRVEDKKEPSRSRGSSVQRLWQPSWKTSAVYRYHTEKKTKSCDIKVPCLVSQRIRLRKSLYLINPREAFFLSWCTQVGGLPLALIFGTIAFE